MIRNNYKNSETQKGRLINWFKVNEIIMIIICTSLINIYPIFKSGLILYLPYYNDNIETTNSIFKISEKEILILLFISIAYLIIFSSYSPLTNLLTHKDIHKKVCVDQNSEYNFYLSFEYFFVLFSSLLGLFLIVIFNDYTYLFIAIEVYSLSFYLLILVSNFSSSSNYTTKINSFYSILYFIFNSIASFLLLFSFILFYFLYGITSLDSFSKLISSSSSLPFLAIIIFLSLFFKLGLAPFHFWVIRIYKIMNNNLLIYFLFVPKVVYLFIFFKFLLPSSLLVNNMNLFNLFLFIAILSSIIGSIGGLYHNNFNLLITYSSIFNLGFLLFGFLSYFQIITFGTLHTFEYLFIYFFHLISIFFAYFLFNKSSSDNSNILSNLFLSLSSSPFFALSFLFTIFSFIGLPPFSGFFAKLNIFLSLFNLNNNMSILFILFLFLVTLFSASLYLKFIYSIFFANTQSHPIHDNSNLNNELLISSTPQKLTYSLSFFTLSLILYPFISLYFFPYFFFIF